MFDFLKTRAERATTQKKKKKVVKRPSPKLLGDGMARRAGDALKRRRQQMDDMLKEM